MPFTFGGSAAGISGLASGTAERTRRLGSTAADSPKKEGDNDLTYIPVTEKVLSMKNGGLMIEYKLLPAIAVQAWERLHEK